jgi:DNA-binding GntR family transcriptional regulator
MKSLSLVPDDAENQSFMVERSLLKDQVAELLRDYVMGGRIAPGTKLVERDIAEAMGVSRAPARDALIQLEREGLVVSRPNGRYVIEPTGQDIQELYQVRHVLERLAIELATQNRSAEDSVALSAKLEEMKGAFVKRDRLAFARTDVEFHRLIWGQSGNRHLQKTLDSMSGAIFMFAANNADFYKWSTAFELHEELVNCINTGDTLAAVKRLELHNNETVARLLKLFD